MLAQNNIHVHLYSESYHKAKGQMNRMLNKIAPYHFHIHHHCPNYLWLQEFSQYDAGWLHCFDSHNEGDLLRLSWDDINLPARMGVFAVAGLPMIQKDNTGHKVATEQILKRFGIGVLYNSLEDLVSQLCDKTFMDKLSDNMWKHRMNFTFESYVLKLITFFNDLINK